MINKAERCQVEQSGGGGLHVTATPWAIRCGILRGKCLRCLKVHPIDNMPAAGTAAWLALL